MNYDTGAITSFRGEYFFLSNYCVTPFVWRGIDFHSGEQAFAYAKTFFSVTEKGGNFFRDKILDAKTPGESKKHGRSVQIDVSGWDKRKVQYMREIVHAKFLTGRDSLGHGIVGPLGNTGATMLIEGNTWGDYFWGRVKDADGIWRGSNTLGVILMEERGWWTRGSEGRPNEES